MVTPSAGWADPGGTVKDTYKKWRELIHVISRRLCLQRLHLSIDASVDANFIQEQTRDCRFAEDDGPPDALSLWTEKIKLAHRRIFDPIIQRLKGRLGNFHVFLCWGIENDTEGIMERTILGEGYRGLTKEKVNYYERDKRNPHWKFNENENRRWTTGLEDATIVDIHDEDDVRWLSGM